MKNSQSLFLSILLLSFIFIACGKQSQFSSKPSNVPNHLIWDSLLSIHVNDEGLVNYQGFIRDSLQLGNYLVKLSTNSPNSDWASDDELAYWINLYNAATIQLIINHYPVNSIKDIGSSIQIPFINTPWQIKFIGLNGEIINLDRIEHSIVRKKFSEPRIHFALVCAARSCPKLRNEAYQGYRLDYQLTEQAKTFFADDTKNSITLNHAVISKLFKWYGGDFRKSSGLIDYLNQYSPVKIDQNAEIDYMDYDWQLNEK